MKRVLEGSQSVAEAVRMAKVQVVSAYPITPQTHIVEFLSEYCASGTMNARFLRVESEHSCMAALIGAQSAGVRTFTATSGQGLALMHELLHWAAGARLPIVMAEVNRALAPGWNIWVDQTDSLAQRDTGWIQFYCEDSQEVIDTTLQAYRLAESVALPVMVVGVVCILIAFFALSPVFVKLLYSGEWIDDSYRPDVTFESRLRARLRELNLSPKETEVCELLLRGYTLRQTAAMLEIAYSTANTYCTSLYRKLGINSRTELTLLFKEYIEA